MKFVFFSIFVSVFFSTSQANPFPKELEEAMEQGMQALRSSEQVCIHFTEKRQLAGLSQEFESTGRIWVDKTNEQIRWQLGEDAQTLLIVNATSFYLRQGNEVEQGSREDLGENAILVELIEALFQGDKSALDARFSPISAEDLEVGWRVILRPNAQPVREAMGDLALQIHANGLPHAWAIRLADGTSLTTTFHQIEMDCLLAADLFDMP